MFVRMVELVSGSHGPIAISVPSDGRRILFVLRFPRMQLRKDWDAEFRVSMPHVRLQHVTSYGGNFEIRRLFPQGTFTLCKGVVIDLTAYRDRCNSLLGLWFCEKKYQSRGMQTLATPRLLPTVGGDMLYLGR